MSEELKDDTIQSTEKDQTIKKSNNESVEDVPETGEEGTKRGKSQRIIHSRNPMRLRFLCEIHIELHLEITLIQRYL